jgi:glycosyltransferase involved in cell wall biosynthesis
MPRKRAHHSMSHGRAGVVDPTPVAPEDILFVGLGATSVCYYRVLLPAHAIGADYVGLVGEPPQAHYRTGLVRGRSEMPDFTDYKVVVLQQPFGEGWLRIIRALRERGTVVIYEVDDWLHSVGNQSDHDFHRDFDRHQLGKYEACMKACDAMIVSTPFIARVYRSFNRRVFVCHNGIDLGRYQLTIPPRPTTNVGWAGATGHMKALRPWLTGVAEVMQRHPQTCFVSIGQSYAEAFKEHFGPERAISVPFTAIEQYPAAMTMFDIAIAPAGRSGFHKAKSDLRWLEASALGIPIIADPGLYPDIEDGETGFHARDGDQLVEILHELVADPKLRTRVGGQAQEFVREHRTIEAMADQWRRAFEALVD